jgi:hypothetical protein
MKLLSLSTCLFVALLLAAVAARPAGATYSNSSRLELNDSVNGWLQALAQTPEPASLLLFGTGMVVIARLRKRN